MSKFLVFLKNNWQEAGKWLIAAVFGLILGKACDRIWPEDPVVVKEVTDTIKIIHAISPLPRETDSLMKEQIQQQLLNIKLLNEYDSYIKQKNHLYRIYHANLFLGILIQTVKDMSKRTRLHCVKYH